MADLRWQECLDPGYWDSLVAASPQGTLFSSHAWLKALGCRYRCWLALDGARALGMIAACESENGEDLRQMPFTPYQGLLFAAPPERAAPPLSRQQVQQQFCIAEFMIERLCQTYRNIDMSLSWLAPDIRPLLWHNFHKPQLGQFRLQPRYTALLHLQDSAYMQAQARACRRQENRKAAAFSVDFHASLGDFMDLYTQTFARQGIALAPAVRETVARLCHAAQAGGFGCLSACRSPAQTGLQAIASSTLFVHDEKRAYYLFAANNPALRHSGGATRLIFANFEHARLRGLPEVDVVGVNSPKRGDFKLSFNPALTLYFDAHLTPGQPDEDRKQL
ncbi:GNAT family N-acetyltransferase [Massilia sp. W12]|uniref:GNAT family N-acetyltransferase n=1 Tax=Massilia sp. W12 TaxID=3126507 RepID=UPI0030CD0B17